jgi:GNAT superfamily N-acetyltransferase
MKIRPARPGDVEGMLRIKRELKLDPAGDAPGGGFLLGATREQYGFLVANAQVLALADDDGALGGFAIALPNAVLRSTDLWARRRSIQWGDGNWDALEDARVAYFDQLAVRPGRRHRTYAPALALAALQRLATTGHQHLFATVVREPVMNLASPPLLHAIGAARVGSIEEHYPEVGRVVSDVYHLALHPGTAADLASGSALGGRIARTLERLAN